MMKDKWRIKYVYSATIPGFMDSTEVFDSTITQNGVKSIMSQTPSKKLTQMIALTSPN